VSDDERARLEAIAAWANAGAGADDPRRPDDGWSIVADASRRLAVYGTLRPGEVNEELLAGMGSWEPVRLRGRLATWHGYPIFTPAFDGDPGEAVSAQLLTSVRLPSRYDALDAFEGPAYRRAIVVVETVNGLTLANCYIAAGG